jgi:hypothetical protein
MANEIQLPHPQNQTAKNLYALVRNVADGQVYAGATAETYVTANLATYAIGLTEQGTASRFYAADFPAIVTPGIYSIAVYERAGGAPAEGDRLLGFGEAHWNGAELVPASGLAEAEPAELDFGTRDVYAGCTEDLPFSVYLFDNNGTDSAALAEADVVHFVLSERTKGEPDTELLDISSAAYTANKSRVILSSLGNAITGAPATGYVRFGQADTDAIVDAWSNEIRSKHLVGEMYFIDASETQPTSAKKLLLRGVIHLHRSGAQ